MATPTVALDIHADLQNEDETGYVWTYLDRALRPELIVPGCVVIAGSGLGRCLARVVDVVDGPGGPLVHLDLIEGSVAEFERFRQA